MSEPARVHVPALSPSLLTPRRVALGTAVLGFADAVAYPLFTARGLGHWGQAALWTGPEAPRALLGVVLVPLLAGLSVAALAMHARSIAGTVVGCLASGAVFSVLTLAAGEVLLRRLAPESAGFSRQGDTAELTLVTSLFPGQALSFGLALTGLALPVSRSRRLPSCDALHEALVVSGTWLVAWGSVVRWTGFGLALGVHVPLDPRDWSLPPLLAGLPMILAGVLSDRTLLTWTAAVRRGEEPGWKMEPTGDRVLEVISLQGARGPLELDGVLVLDRGSGPRPVAGVVLDGSDRRRLVLGRLRSVATTAALLLGVLVTVLMKILAMGLPW